VLLNSSKPYSKETLKLAEDLSEKYNVTVMPVNCDQLKKEDVLKILENILLEFPVTELDFYTPQWLEMLPEEHWLKAELIGKASEVVGSVDCIRDIKQNFPDVTGEYLDTIQVSKIDMSDGKVQLNVQMKPHVYYDVLSELTGMPINNEYELIHIIRELSEKKVEFDKVADALTQVEGSGFGVVTPVKEEIVLEEPEVIKNGSKYGVKIKAQVPSINMIKTNINVEIAPIVGTKNQADDLIGYIKENSSANTDGIWKTNIFGKTIQQIVDDGIYEKTHNITPENMEKISSTLEKVMNENSGLVCLIV
jgi:stage IV sporulation protein A